MKLPYWVLAILAGVLFLCLSQISLGYPEMVRLGYNGCSSCHVSPTGGGALTAYGRSTSEEISSFSREGDGQFLQNAVPLPKWLSIGGDARYLSLRAGEVQRNFPMQADLELAVHPLSYLWLDASYGVYGESRVAETRRNYLIWVPSKYWSLRFGKFFPAYGVLQPDHTVSVRSGIGWREGTETYNAEFYLHGDQGEVFITGMLGTGENDAQVQLSDQQGYQVLSAESGVVGRAAVYLGSSAQLGLSGAFVQHQDYRWALSGIYGIWGVTRNFYIEGEADRRTQTDATPPTNATWEQVGLEAVRGVHLLATHELLGDVQTVGAGLQWFPLPHYEILGRAKYTVEADQWTYVLMAHVNL